MQRVRGGRQAGFHVAPAHVHGRKHIALRRQRVLHRQDGGQGVDVQRHLARGAARLHYGARHHQANHLAYVLHRVDGKHRLVSGKGGQHRVAGNIGAQDHAHHAGHGQRGTRVHATQMAVGLGGQDGRCVQGAAQLGHVVNIGGGTRHLG